MRWAAADALGKIGPEAKQDAIPHLVALLKDPEWACARSPLTVLGKIGPAAKDAIPHLVALLKDPNVGVPGRRLCLGRDRFGRRTPFPASFEL